MRRLLGLILIWIRRIQLPIARINFRRFGQTRVFENAICNKHRQGRIRIRMKGGQVKFREISDYTFWIEDIGNQGYNNVQTQRLEPVNKVIRQNISLIREAGDEFFC